MRHVRLVLGIENSIDSHMAVRLVFACGDATSELSLWLLRLFPEKSQTEVWFLRPDHDQEGRRSMCQSMCRLGSS